MCPVRSELNNISAQTYVTVQQQNKKYSQPAYRWLIFMCFLLTENSESHIIIYVI